MFQDKQMSLNNELDEFRSIWEVQEKRRLESIDEENRSIEEKYHTELMLSIEYNRKKKNEISRDFGKLNESKMVMETKVKEYQEKEMLRLYEEVDRLNGYKQQLGERMDREYEEAQEYYRYTLSEVERDFEEKLGLMRSRF